MTIEYKKEYPTIAEGEKKRAAEKAKRLEAEHKARKGEPKPKKEKPAKE